MYLQRRLDLQLQAMASGVGDFGSTGNREGHLQLRAMAVEFPAVLGHPNRVPFAGVLTLVDVASDKAPSGARGHRVVLTRAAAEAALPSLMGMAVDFKTGWDGHDARQKCGIVTAARVRGRTLCVEGYLFARDYSEMMREMEAHGDEVLGMSYELADAHVEDMNASEWKLTKVTFTGAAILLREKAAYKQTSFRIVREQAAALLPLAAAAGGAIESRPARTHAVRLPARGAARTREERGFAVRRMPLAGGARVAV